MMKFLLTFLAISLLASCGGGDNKSANDNSNALKQVIIQKNLDGIWSNGKTDESEKVGMMLSENAQVLISLKSPEEAIILGTLNSIDADKINITGTLYPSWETKKVGRSVKLTGNIGTNGQITLNYEGELNEFRGTINLGKAKKQDSYLKPSNLAQLAGIWKEVIHDPKDPQYEINIKQDGSYNLTKLENCIVNGKFKIVNTSKNFYSVSATFNSCDGFQSKFNGQHEGFGLLSSKGSLIAFIGNTKALFLIDVNKPTTN